VLEEFLGRINGLVKSVVLVGSKVMEKTTERSDTDLIIIANDKNAVEQIQRILQNQDDSSNRPELDCKVYTEEDFSKAKGGKSNFFLWTALMNSRVLLGHDISSEVKMKPNLVRSALWNSQEDVENACSNFESNTQFTGSCFSLYSSLTTLYFAEKHFLRGGQMKITKEEYIRKIVKNQHETTRNRYYWVARKWRTSNSEIVNIPLNIDKKFHGTDYANMYEVTSQALQYFQTMTAKILTCLDHM